MVKMIHLIFLVIFVKIKNPYNLVEARIIIVAQPIISALDIILKAQTYFLNIRTVLKEINSSFEETKCASGECNHGVHNFNIGPNINCVEEKNNLSKCALRMFLSLGDSFDSDEFITALLIHKYLLDEAHSFALCTQYYKQTNNAGFFNEIISFCRVVTLYFLEIASFFSNEVIDGMIKIHNPQMEMQQYFDKDYFNMPLEIFKNRFPMKEPLFKEKTINAIKNLFELRKYITYLLEDTSMSCFSANEEERLWCLLTSSKSDEMKVVFENLEAYLDKIHCHSILGQSSSVIAKTAKKTMAIQKMVWEELSYVISIIQDFDGAYNGIFTILTEIEMAKMKIQSEIDDPNDDKPKVPKTINYRAIWSSEGSRSDLIWVVDDDQDVKSNV